MKKDLYSGLMVSLLAIPLCVAIATASGFPAAAGLMTAIVAGFVASSGAPLSIKGPAAGLIVVMLDGVQKLGGGLTGYRGMLAVGCCAGVLQIWAGRQRYARIADAVPPAVIHGMLAGIGFIILAKQLPILMGIETVKGSPTQLLVSLPQLMLKSNPLILMLGVLSLGVLTVALQPKTRLLKILPAPLLVIGLGLTVSLWLDIAHDHHLHLWGLLDVHVSKVLLVSIPQSMVDAVVFPDFAALSQPWSWFYILVLTLIGSIESTLTIHALDKLSFPRPPSDPSQDLFVLGIGNVAASLLGGLPMISEIARSRANFDYGAISGRSQLVHSVSILLALVVLPQWIASIPVCVLAAMLIMVAVKLIHPHQFVEAWSKDKVQCFILAATMLVTFSIDILAGVATGLVLKLIMHRWAGHSFASLFKLHVDIDTHTPHTMMTVKGPLAFSNILRFHQLIHPELEHGRRVDLDLSRAPLLDKTAISKLQTLQLRYSSLEIRGWEHPAPPPTKQVDSHVEN